MELMAELRSALNAPSETSWSKIRWALERWQGEHGIDRLVDVALPYCRPHLRRWPADLRRPAPSDWVTRLKRGERVPAMELATEVFVEPTRTRHAHERAERLMRVLTAAARADMHTIHIDGYSLSAPPLEPHVAIIGEMIEGGLVHLEMTNCSVTAHTLKKLMRDRNMSSLRHLGVRHNQIGNDGTAYLSRRADLALLERLDVRDNYLTARALRQLAPRGRLASLKRIDYLPGNSDPARWRLELMDSRHVTEELRDWFLYGQDAELA